MRPDWKGVYPAVSTQFRADDSIDFEQNASMWESLIQDGVHGIIVCGTVGEKLPAVCR